MRNRKRKLIVILGPTASGKSMLGIKLAKKFNGEIISVDSRQVYKELNLASGKITKKEMKGVKHYCIDEVTPKTYYTIAHFKKSATKAIEKIRAKKKIPFMVGGTAFYIKAITDNLFIPEISPDWELRRKLEKKSADTLFNMLKKLDPRRASAIEPKNKRRLVRAIEIIKSSGKPVPLRKSDFLKGSQTSLLFPNVLFLGIKVDREKLKRNIEKRIDERLKKGMIAEIEKLHAQGVSWKRLDSLGLEARWIAKFLQKKILKETMKQKLLRDTYHFVRHQYTWWKKDKRIHWARSQKEAAKLIRQFL